MQTTEHCSKTFQKVLKFSWILPVPICSRACSRCCVNSHYLRGKRALCRVAAWAVYKCTCIFIKKNLCKCTKTNSTHAHTHTTCVHQTYTQYIGLCTHKDTQTDRPGRWETNTHILYNVTIFHGCITAYIYVCCLSIIVCIQVHVHVHVAHDKWHIVHRSFIVSYWAAEWWRACMQ